MNNEKTLAAVLLALFLVIVVIASSPVISSYSPRKGDYFHYSETITVNNGQGSYTGYTDQSQISGTEQMNRVSGSTVFANYSYSYQYSNNQGNSSSRSSSGPYSWSSSSFTYVNGTDDQTGYSRPISVWFAMNSSLPVGAKFFVLNTPFVVLSKNYSFFLPGGRYVQTIQAKASGQYQRNDSYGVFTAPYTWYAYFDPTTGYIVGYNYLEQDSGEYQGQAGSFTYTDNLYTTLTSYALALANPPPLGNASTISNTPFFTMTNQGSLFGFDPFVVYFIVGVVFFILIFFIVGIYALTRRKGKDSLSKHPYTTPPSSPSDSTINLGSKPPEQVVIREVGMVNCRYCGTLIPSTAQTCPYCGGPRQ